MNSICRRRAQPDFAAVITCCDEVVGSASGDTVRILVVRHHRRNRSYGLERR